MVMCMLVIVAPPILMGVWSMAFLLGQHVEYYCMCINPSLHNSSKGVTHDCARILGSIARGISLFP